MTVYERPEHPDHALKIHLAPAAAAKLGGEQHRQAAADDTAAPPDLPGRQSLGHGHRPAHASGRQGPGEKKVRW